VLKDEDHTTHFIHPQSNILEMSNNNKMADKVKGVAAEEADRLKTLTTEAVKSKAYLYPIKVRSTCVLMEEKLIHCQGIYYFAAHRDLWRPLTSRLASTLTLSVGVTTFMFVFAYLPQAAIMTFTNGPLAAITAAVLTLSESSTLVNLISRTFLIQDALIDTFDGTLVSRECTGLVSDNRQVKSGRDSIARLGKLITRPLAKFTPSAIIRYLLYLPLNIIPGIGTAIFILLQGKRSGPAAHARYFQLKGWQKSQREAFVAQNQGAYTS
jgi:hypothetical protein